jgi:hypothetical protein
MAEETETFAFQAEINQLLSLIINVRRGSFLLKLLSLLFVVALALFLWIHFPFDAATSVFFLSLSLEN